jgi:hypothetical protein
VNATLSAKTMQLKSTNVPLIEHSTAKNSSVLPRKNKILKKMRENFPFPHQKSTLKTYINIAKRFLTDEINTEASVITKAERLLSKCNTPG